MNTIVKAVQDFFRTGPEIPCTIRDPAELRRTYERRRWSVFLSITLGYGLFYVCRINFSVVKKPLLDAGLLDTTQMGAIGFALLIGYAIGKAVNGFLADRSNIRRFMSAGLLASALLNLVLGFGVGFWMFLVAWGVNGWLQSMGAAPSIVSMAHWYSRRERGSRYGIWCISHNLGEGMTFIVTAFLVSVMGDWRWGFWGPGLLCLGGALVMFRTLYDRPEATGLPPVAVYKNDPAPADAHDGPVEHLQRQVLRNPAVWVLGLSSAAMYVARYGINNWGVLFLQEGKGYSLPDAGSLMAVYAVTGFLGSFFSGILSDRFFQSRRNLPCLLAGIFQILSLVAMWQVPAGYLWLDELAGVDAPAWGVSLDALPLAVFGFAMGILVSFLGGLMAVDIVPHRAAGAAAGLVGMISYVGAAVQDVTSGWLLDLGKTVSGDQVTYSFDGVFAFWIGAGVLSMLMAALVWNAAEAPSRRAAPAGASR